MENKKKNQIQQVGNLLKSARSASDEKNDDKQFNQKQRADLFQWACRQECSSFSVDDENTKSLMNELFLYANGCCKMLNPSKGLWLYGPPGTGKSTIIQILRTYDFQLHYKSEEMRSSGGFGIISASMVSNLFARKGLDGIDLYGYNSSKPVPMTWAFDEVGREPCPAKHFGMEMNVMQFIFQTRYEIRHKCLTHVTTNMSPEQLTSKYGDYIADRVNEMFNVIEVKGESRR